MANAASSVTSSTNLDVNSIVTQLMKVERQPIDKLEVKEASYQAKLTSYGTIKGAVSAFETAVSGLNNATKFQSLKATPSDATIFSASATSIATAGSYSLEVTNLAQAQNLIADGQASITEAIGAAEATTTLTFDLGTISGGSFTAYNSTTETGGTYSGSTFTSNGVAAQSITINSSNNTLGGIRDAINEADIGITATIVNDGDATAPYRLVLSSDDLGASNSMRITVSGDATISGLLAHNPAGTQNLAQTVTAQNANLKVNGVAVSKESNSISDVIHGVTLNLLTETATPVKLTVARDTSTISTSVTSFVKAYNELAEVFKTETAYDAAAKKGAVLMGDSTIRSLQSQLRSILGSAIPGTSGALNTLSDIGVSFKKDGTLELDQTRLDSAMEDHFSDIAILFSSDDGYLTTLNTFTTSILSSNGMLANRTDGIGRTIADIKQRAAKMETRLLTIEKRYRAQFTALDVMLSGMNATSTYLTQQLAQISNNN